MYIEKIKKTRLVFAKSIVLLLFFPLCLASGQKLESSSGIILQKVKPGVFLFGAEVHPSIKFQKMGEQVEVGSSFWMSQTEISQRQWKKVMQISFEKWSRDRGRKVKHIGDDLPVYGMSYFEACRFCDWLTDQDRKSGIINENQKYRLPSEVQWEYVCRAGSETLFFSGDMISREEANLNYGLAHFAEYDRHKGEKNGKDLSRPWRVNSMKENAWGFYGMAGNVSEWCADIYREKPLNKNENPITLAQGEELFNVRVVSRGGNWRSAITAGFSSSRHGLKPWGNYQTMGFRIVLINEERGQTVDCGFDKGAKP